MKPDNPFGIPDLSTAKRVLAVQPHYDDNDLAAGGTLAALAAEGRAGTGWYGDRGQ
jgi:LmbE family N-acetylglucosaminyl deacetylase